VAPFDAASSLMPLGVPVGAARWLAREAVDHAPAFHGRPFKLGEITPMVGPEAAKSF
jgi:hypothetical protein